MTYPVVTIYENAVDFPNCVSSRLFVDDRATNKFSIFRDVNDARVWAREVLGVYGVVTPMVTRDPEDGDCVVENWL